MFARWKLTGAGLLCCGLIAACSGEKPAGPGPGPQPDSIPPTISLSTAVCCYFPTGSTITLRADIQDNVGVTRVEFFVQRPGTTTPSLLLTDSIAPFEATYPDGGFTGAFNGTLSFTARAFDAAGNVGHSSPFQINIDIDVTAPLLAIVPYGETLTSPGFFLVQVQSNEGLAKLELYDNGVKRYETTATVIPYWVRPTYDAADNGDHVLTAKGYDAEGNVGTSPPLTIPVDIRWQWVSGVGPAQAYSIAADAAYEYVGGFALSAPDTNGFTTHDAYVAKLTSDHIIVWRRTFGDIRNEQDGNSVAVDQGTGDVYLAGDTYVYGARPENQVFINKYDADGTLQWSREIGDTVTDDRGIVATDGAGAIYVAGSTWGSVGGPNEGGQDVFLVKYDRDGNVIWARQHGSTGGPFNHDYTTSLAVAPDGSVYIGGYSDGSMDPGVPSDDYGDAFLLKYDPGGNLVWGRLLGVSFPADYITGVSVAPSGDVYVTGWNYGGLDGGPVGGIPDILVAKFTSAGALEWTRQLGSTVLYAGSPYDYGSAVSADTGGVYVTGLTTADLEGNVHQGLEDAVLVRYAADGTLRWVRTLGGAGGWGVAQDGAGAVYIVTGAAIAKHL